LLKASTVCLALGVERGTRQTEPSLRDLWAILNKVRGQGLATSLKLLWHVLATSSTLSNPLTIDWKPSLGSSSKAHAPGLRSQVTHHSPHELRAKAKGIMFLRALPFQ